MLDYSFKIESCIYILSVTKDPFVTHLTTILSSLLKLFIEFAFYYSFLERSVPITRPTSAFRLS
jgi:hypothetical protein